MPVDINKLLTDYGVKLVEQLKADIKQKQVTKYGAVNASGKLHDSIRFEVNGSVLTIFGEDYIYYLQYGRKNGKRPPSSVIREWIENKPSAQQRFGWSTLKEYQKDGISFAIAKKIGEEGTTIWQQGGTDLVSSIFNENLQREIENSFGNLIASEIESEVLKAFA